MSTGQLTPAQIRIRDKVAHLTPGERQRVLAAAGTLAPKNNMEVLKRQDEALKAAAATSSPNISRKQPSPEAIEIAAKMLANKARREANKGQP